MMGVTPEKSMQIKAKVKADMAKKQKNLITPSSKNRRINDVGMESQPKDVEESKVGEDAQPAILTVSSSKDS